MKTLLVIDDHPIVLEGIRSILTRRGFRVHKAETRQQAMAIMKEFNDIDMIVSDLSLSNGTDGLDLIERMRAEGFSKPVVVYTMHEELWNISRLMKSDVEGIVLKGENLNELVLAIRLVSEGKTYRSSAFDRKRREVMQTDGILSSKDIEVLRRLSAGESNRDIAQALGLSEKTVEYHRGNILKKLCSKTMLEATRRAVSLGIIRLIIAVALSATASATTNASDRTPEAVDLGLSVLWADRNLEASHPYESGGFYAFGETFTKEVYNWTTYTHCDGSFETCHDLGVSDISNTIYDAASVILGDGWRIPTDEEQRELFENVSHSESSVDGYGKIITFTAANGNAISLPICGYMSEGRLIYADINGIYNSSNCEFSAEEIPEYDIVIKVLSPTYAAIGPDFVLTSLLGTAQLGGSIRPVKDKDNSAIDSPLMTAKSITGIYGMDGTSFGTDLENVPAGICIIVYSDGSTEKKIKR